MPFTFIFRKKFARDKPIPQGKRLSQQEILEEGRNKLGLDEVALGSYEKLIEKSNDPIEVNRLIMEAMRKKFARGLQPVIFARLKINHGAEVDKLIEEAKGKGIVAQQAIIEYLRKKLQEE